LSRMYLLPAASQDYFDDDDGDANEAAHNKVAAAGLIMGYADNNGGRRDFKGGDKATRDMLAIVAVRAHDKGLVPVWDIPTGCITGGFDGTFCDDDGTSGEPTIERLVGELDVPFACRDLAGSPAFCASKEVSRANSMYVLGKAADVPLDGHPDGFRDDDGHAREPYLNAAKAYGIFTGYNGGVDAKPDNIANRTTLAIILSRIYNLPAPSDGTDYFSDDDGTSSEPWHNKVGAAGLFTGYDDGNGGRKFRGDVVATRGTLATLAVRAADAGLVPVWAPAAPAPLPPPEEEEPAPVDDSSVAPDVDDLGDDDDDVAADDASLDDPEPSDGPAPVDEDTVLPDDISDEGALEGPPEGLDPTVPLAPSTGPEVRAGCSVVDVNASLAALAALGALLTLRRRTRRRGGVSA